MNDTDMNNTDMNDTRAQRRESPVLSRCRKLVHLFRSSKTLQQPLDEVSILELLDPIHDPATVLSMCAYLGIKLPEPKSSNSNTNNNKNNNNINNSNNNSGGLGTWESHLVWIAKLAILDELPDGWEEVIIKNNSDDLEEIADEDQSTNYSVQYIKKDNDMDDYVSGEHPNDASYRQIIARERAKRPPKEVLFKDLYEYGPIRSRKETNNNNNKSDNNNRSLSSSILPALGLYMDLYDSTGTKYFYHVVRSNNIIILSVCICHSHFIF